MHFESHGILIILSGIVVLSYVFDLLSKWTRIPSVLMLISAGIGFKYLSVYLNIEVPDTAKSLEILGIVGLILIVLEGSLDLKLTRERLPMVKKSLGTAFFTLILTSLLTALILHEWLDVPFRVAFVNSIPFAVISSAIAIPSVKNLDKDKKEFIIYESTFSDILGIMLFNFATEARKIGIDSFLNFGINLVSIAIISILSCLMLIFFMDRIKMHIKFFLIFALLVGIYAIGKLLNLSSLLLVLVFGTAIKNVNLFLKGKLLKFFNPGKLDGELLQLKLVTAESAFLIRTFFFILFGFSFNMSTMADPEVWFIGGLVVLIILAIRYIYLKFFVKGSIFPELFVAPRGLVTILLFFSISQEYIIPGFSRGVLFFVIIVTSILMMIGLAFAKDEPVPELKELTP